MSGYPNENDLRQQLQHEVDMKGTDMTTETETRKWIVAWQQTMADGTTHHPSSNPQISGTHEEMRDHCHKMNAKWAKGQTEILEPTYTSDETVVNSKGKEQKVVVNLRPELEGAVFYWPKLPEKQPPKAEADVPVQDGEAT